MPIALCDAQPSARPPGWAISTFLIAIFPQVHAYAAGERNGALGKVASPTRTCQSDYELLAGVDGGRKILGLRPKRAAKLEHSGREKPLNVKVTCGTDLSRAMCTAPQAFSGSRHQQSLNPTLLSSDTSTRQRPRPTISEVTQRHVVVLVVGVDDAHGPHLLRICSQAVVLGHAGRIQGDA